MKLSNEKEKEFFGKLIPADYVINDSPAETPKKFLHHLIENNHYRSAAVKDLAIEITDNLLLLVESASREAYLNRLKNKVKGSIRYLDENLLFLDNGKKFCNHLRPGLPTFRVPRKPIIDHIKAGKFYLALISAFLLDQEKAERSTTVEAGKKVRPQIAPSFTLKIAGKHSRLKDVYKTLQDIGALDCGVTTFKKVFSGKELSEKIVWNAHPYLLQRFIHFIHNQHGIVEKVPDHWSVTLNCFEGRTKQGPFKKETLSKAKGTPKFQKLVERMKRSLNNL